MKRAARIFELHPVQTSPDGTFKVLRTISWGYSWDSISNKVTSLNVRFHPMPPAAKSALKKYIMQNGTL